jgi:hypothetical protein
MKSTTIAFVTGVLICMFSASVVSQSSKDWVDIKNPKELRALFSDKTHRGKAAGTPYVTHYSSDGRGVLLWVGQHYPRTWEVKGSEVCITAATGPGSGTTCRTYQRHRTNRNDVVGLNAGGFTVQFIVEEGIPKF